MASPGSAEPMTVAQALRRGADRLRAVEPDNPRLAARLLLAHALGQEPAALIRDPQARIDPTVFDALVDQRLAHVPLAHLVGRRGFWSFELLVTRATLVPRPDSETIVEAALRATDDRSGTLRVLDLGTGTGCLLLAVLTERPAAFGVGVDRSAEALQVAVANAERLGLADRARFIRGDWMDAIGARFDLVLSNPPYIPTGDIAELMPEVACHEPRLALDGGTDGLDAYRRIIPALAAILAEGGVAVLEIGIDQAAAVAELGFGAGLRVDVRPDLGGIPRAVILGRAGR